MKAIQTTYAGVNFRSRLEAKWAAFFDLIGLHWDYEPFDLEGWTPDFLVMVAGERLLVEVKPVGLSKVRDLPGLHLESAPCFEKARRHCPSFWVLLLGERPNTEADIFGIGLLLDPPVGTFTHWIDVHNEFCSRATEQHWRSACNLVQWGGRVR